MPNPRAVYRRLPEPRPPFAQFLIARAIQGFKETPWEIDLLFGLGLFGFGVIFLVAPPARDTGFNYILPILGEFSTLVGLIGLAQIINGLLEWKRGRQVIAFVAFFIYIGFATRHQAIPSRWIYGLGALAEGLIVLKRY